MTSNLTNKLDSIINEIIAEAKTYNFNLNSLPEVNGYKTDIRIDSNFSHIFNDLNLKVSNCLYWFDIKSKNKAFGLNSLLNENRALLNENKRVVPALNSNIESSILYVGIRRGGQRKYDGLTNISGRIIQHLGFYEKGSTQGLQLVHWVNKSDLEVTLFVAEFPELPNEYLEIFEKLVALKLKPLCGKH